ncbi:MAG: carboxypeptidase regulatory-like domain-containing protein [Acidobacteriota bacterium]
MTKRGVVLFGALLCVLAIAGAAFAQEQTGSIQGVVKDSSGAVLPGATVEAKSPNSVGTSSTVTDDKGVYRFPALPPGVYEISATLQGFNPAKLAGISVTLGKSLTVELTLAVGAVSETVQVKAEAPLIDVKQNATFATIQADTIDRIPKGRDFQTILKTAPGAQDESKAGGIQVDGASGSENRFVIDGMDTTAMSNGLSGKTLLLDFIQEVQVKSSGYNAEFGGATGGVVSAITKSGSNSIRGQVGTYYQSNTNSFWIGEKRKFNRFDPYNTNLTNLNYVVPDTPWTYMSPLGDIGGPVFKDKLWYYAGVGYTKNSYNEDVTFYGDPNRVSRHFDWWSTAKYYNYNLTTQVTNNLRVKFSGQNQRDANRKTAPGFQPQGYVFPDGTAAASNYTTSTFDKNADGSVNQTAYDSRWTKQGGNSMSDIYSGNVDWVITNTFFVNASGGYYHTNSWSPAEFRGNDTRHVFNTSNSDSAMIANGFTTVPSQYQQVNGYSDVISSFGTVRNDYTRKFFNANLTFFQNLAGQHTFKAGARFEQFGNDVLNGNAKPVINLYWGTKYINPDTGVASAGTYGYYAVNQTGTIGKVQSNNWSLWFQDSWSVNNKLTVNAGIRAETENIPSYKVAADALNISFKLKDKIAPRLGFAYDVKGDGKWKAYGSYGWYYTITPLNLARGAFGGDHWIDYSWTLNTADFSSINCGEGTSGCPGTFLGSTDYRHSSNQVDPLFATYFNRPGMTGIDPNLKPVKTGEFTAGVDHELGPLMSVGVRYVHKWMFRTIEDIGIYVSGNEDYLIGNPGESLGAVMEPAYPAFVTPKAKRNYDSVELKLRRRLANNWSGEVSYLWSRLFGNYSGLTSSDEGGGGAGRTDAPNTTRYWDNTVQSFNAAGQAVYGNLPTDRPHAVKVQGTYDFKTGTSVGAFFIVQSGIPQTTVVRFTGYPVFVYGRGDLGRSPVYSQMDLVASQEVRFGKSRRLVFQANIDNLFDQSTWYGLYNVSSGYGPQPYRDSITLSMPPGVLYQTGGYSVANIVSSYKGTLRTNPLYTTPNIFQGRRAVRLSIKFAF